MNAVLHDDVIVATIASGSRGNCTYIGTERDGVLIDCGLSTRQIFTRLDELGLGDARLHAVLITHEHADHVGAARVLDRAMHKRTGEHLPFHMTAGTRAGLHPSCVPNRVETIVSGRPFAAGPARRWTVEPWTVPHDTTDPVAYAVAIGEVRAGVITDLGRSTRLVERQLGSLDIAVLEFNHDVEMLLHGSYPWKLKQRVRGAHGHLSNDQAGELLARGATERLRHLVLAHLSEENNTPEHALAAAQDALHGSVARGVTVHVASQQVPLGPLRIAPPPASERPPAVRRTVGASPPLCGADTMVSSGSRQLPLFG